MKTTFKILLLVFMGTLWACEKNDPLADQGELTGNIIPFNLLAQMPDAAAGDTIVLRNVSWAVDDDLHHVSFVHSGFKLRNYEVKIAIQVNDANNTVYEMTGTFAEDSIIVAPTPFASYSHNENNLEAFYQTQENAYVILHPFVVPAVYRLSKEKDQALINVMAEDIYMFFVNKFSENLNRNILLTIFPNLSPYSVTYFKFDANGDFTGELTPAGVQYFINNFDRERFNDFLIEAIVTDNTRVNIATEAKIKDSSLGSRSARIFRVL